MAMRINSNYEGVRSLFSGFGGSKNSSGISGMAGLLGDYSSIKNGSYGKLMKSYYGIEKASKKESSSISTAKDKENTIKQLKSSSEDLSESAKALYGKSGSNSVFAKKSTTDENGNKKESYDVDAIYKRVSDFAKSYNDMLVAANKSENDKVVSSVASMITTTGQNKNMLSELGISISSENYRMTIDEDAFKKADMSVAKSLFSGTGSYGYNIAAKASMVNHYATQDASKANTYGSTGDYSKVNNSGALYDLYS